MHWQYRNSECSPCDLSRASRGCTREGEAVRDASPFGPAPRHTQRSPHLASCLHSMGAQDMSCDLMRPATRRGGAHPSARMIWLAPNSFKPSQPRLSETFRRGSKGTQSVVHLDGGEHALGMTGALRVAPRTGAALGTPRVPCTRQCWSYLLHSP